MVGHRIKQVSSTLAARIPEARLQMVYDTSHHHQVLFLKFQLHTHIALPSQLTSDSKYQEFDPVTFFSFPYTIHQPLEPSQPPTQLLLELLSQASQFWSSALNQN